MTNQARRRLKVRCTVGVVAGAMLGLLAMTPVGSTAGIVIVLYDDRTAGAFGQKQAIRCANAGPTNMQRMILNPTAFIAILP